MSLVNYSDKNWSSCPASVIPYFLHAPRNQHHFNFLLSFVVINAVVAVVAALGNLTVICTIIKTPSLRTPSHILILCLSISDLGVGVITEPTYCVFTYLEMTSQVSMFCTVRTVYLTSVWILTVISSLTLTTITVDRFLAIHLHLRYREIVTTKLYTVIICLIWGISIFIGLFRTFIDTGGRILTAAVVIIAVFLLFNIFFHVQISRVVRRHSLQIQAQQQSVQQPLDMPRYKKSVNTTYYVIGAFVMCYFPYSVSLTALAVASEWTHEIRILFTVTETLVMLNGVLNPIIYWWRIKDLRHASISGLLCCSNRLSDRVTE